MTKSNQFKLCRNKICADTRSIKINKKFKRPNHIYRKLYYFYSETDILQEAA